MSRLPGHLKYIGNFFENNIQSKAFIMHRNCHIAAVF
jgi:hypothetical protein